MHRYLCNTSWTTQRLLGMKFNSKWYYIRSGVIGIQRQAVGLWTCIQKEVYRWFTECYEPSKIWFLLRKKPMRSYFFCIIPWMFRKSPALESLFKKGSRLQTVHLPFNTSGRQLLVVISLCLPIKFDVTERLDFAGKKLKRQKYAIQETQVAKNK